MNKNEIKHLFDSYPKQHEFFAASDGTTFLQKQFAEAYAAAKKLEDTHITTISRDDIPADEAPAKKTASVAAPTKTALGKEQKKEAKKHIVTQEDLDANPDLVENGVKVGDEIELPVTEETTEADTSPAPAKAKPKKPAPAKKSAANKTDKK